MMLIDWLLKPIDTYWRRRFHAEEIRANRAAADLRYTESIFKEQEKDLAALTERDVKQARAISAFTQEVEGLRAQIARERLELEQRDREIEVLREALRSERAAQETMRMNARLWEQIKGEVLVRGDDGG